MKNKPRHFEKYQDFLNKRKIYNNNRLLENGKQNYYYRGNNLAISNKTEPSFNLNIQNIEKNNNNNTDSRCLSSLRRQLNTKTKSNTNQNLETNYKTDLTNDSQNKNNNKISNPIKSYINKDKSNHLRFNSSSININNNIEKMINDFQKNNKRNKKVTNLSIDENKNKIRKNRTFSANNINKNQLKINSFSNPNIKNDINDNNKINNLKKNNDYKNYFTNNNFYKNKNKYKYNSLYKPKPKFTFDSPYLNKELDHILSSYDFKNINNDINEINIDDKSIKIHFRNLLFFVKELQAKNDLLKKEIRNKNNLISSLEKHLNNKNNIKKNFNNAMIREFNSDIILDNHILKSEILNLEKKLENQKIYYDDLIKDYKNKLNEQKNRNNIMDNNFKKIENKYKSSNNKLNDIKDELKDVTFMKAKLQDINEKYEIINTEQQKKIENLENQLKVVLTLVKNLFNKENNKLYPMRTKLFYDISNLRKNI